LTRDDTLDRLPEKLPADPMHWADAWLKEAIASRVRPNPNAMTIATVGADNAPSARVVLCKELVPEPGYLVFYSNYESRKGGEIAGNGKAAAVFHWDSLGRQVRIEGLVVKSPPEESDAYFASRSRGSQLGAWGSDQSRRIVSKEALVAQIRARGEKLGLSLGSGATVLADDKAPALSRPPHWGGYRLWASSVELWIEGPDRIHDRGRWTREVVRAREHDFNVTPWRGARLQP
jgi:pyridoxamine 5'-phosphate oxidase